MTIKSVLINVSDIDASVAFYKKFLDVKVISQSADAAELDAVTATINLARIEAPSDSEWIADDLHTGFRHIGFKVSDLQPRVDVLHAADVPFHLEPISVNGDIRITFFFDPDGTLLELVEGPIQYNEVFNQDLVDADWGLGDPDRPRFDHVAETVTDAAATHAYMKDLGFEPMGGLHMTDDERGFEITFLRGGDTSLEVFEFQKADVSVRSPQVDALGFVAAELSGTGPDDAPVVGEGFGRRLFSDPNGFVYADSRE